MEQHPVPVVDLGAGPAVGAALVTALSDHACAWLTGHGVPLTLLDAMVTESTAFFDLPRREKAVVEWPGHGLWRGWQPVVEGADRDGGRHRPDDVVERLEQNLCPTAGGPDNADNRWPTEPATLRPTWEAYHRHLFGLSNRILTHLAGALDLPVEDLADWTDDQFSNLVVNDYPVVAGRPSGALRLGAHADHGGLTILHGAGEAGLESQRPDGTWVPVAPRPGALLVQAGVLLQRWTNGRIPANVHRVGPPTSPPRRRVSVVWFHHPRLDAVVAPAPSCLAPGCSPPEPVLAGDYVTGRQAAYRPGGSRI